MSDMDAMLARAESGLPDSVSRWFDLPKIPDVPGAGRVESRKAYAAEVTAMLAAPQPGAGIDDEARERMATSLARHMTDDDFTALNNAGSRGTGGPKVDVRKQFTMPEHGAATQVWAAVIDELDGCGALYLSDCGVAAAAPYAMDETRALALWALSEHLCTPSARSLGSGA